MGAAPSSLSELEEQLSRPTPRVTETLAGLRGDLVLLGVGGKMGLSLARMARRALDAAGSPARVIGVSRFSQGQRALFEQVGVETVVADLLDPRQVANLPEAGAVIVLAGRKFGSTGDLPLTWAMNAWLPASICQRFPARPCVVFSTGNVYGLGPLARGGSTEEEEPRPVGEYAQSCLARERMYQYFSPRLEIPLAIVRLNYACDLRYGVLVDLAHRVWRGEPVPLEMGWFNTIWQREANERTLLCLSRLTIPPQIVNVTGSEMVSVRWACDEFAQRWNRTVQYVGHEQETALLSSSARADGWWGPPQVSAPTLLDWVARWRESGGVDLGKPTHFESRTGDF